MERLVGIFLRDEMLALLSLHPNQNADHAGKFMETALHWLAFQVEKALNQREIALDVFLIQNGHLITPLMTPCVLLFLNMGLITPSYAGLELPWRTTWLQRPLVDFPRGSWYLEVAPTEVCHRSYGALLLII